ncbi:MAG: hypothetical protein E2O65_04560 [Gammaproteobacteria bacterium]|nr:MAG: hypothetical protein E2O65_04560 [Gammaproteobacteria bacterium]
MSDAQAEAEELVSAVLPHAEGMLIAHGEFFPFGSAVTLDGEITQLAVDEEHQDSSIEDVIEALKGKLRNGADTNTYRATALVFPIQAQLPGAEDETEAVAIALDHQANYSVVLIIPYVLLDGAVEFGEAVAQQGEDDMFQGQH